MIEVPAHRIGPARRIAERLKAGRSIAVATHVRGDGDGWGAASAIACHYGPSGADVRLLAATRFPERFRFLLPEGVEPLTPGDRGREALASADVQIMVDVSEPGRLGDFEQSFEPARTIVIDHHPRPSGRLGWAEALIDPGAAATVELVYDILAAGGESLEPGTARALYVGLVTDTGSFRYSNVSARTHRLAADLVAAGVDPGHIYNLLYGTLTGDELATLRAALDGLTHDPDLPLTWITLGSEVTDRFGELDDYERILEYARSHVGTEIALLFRELEDGSVKVSLRSNGPANVAEIAREFGGGGHDKAAGAVVAGELEEVERRVLERCRVAARGLTPSGDP